MNPAVITSWIQVGSILVTAGIATVGQVKAMIAAHHGVAMTDADLNAIEQGVVDDARRRKALADADAHDDVATNH
jgi:phage FluMu protein gp41